MVLVLFFVSLSPLLSATASNHINYSEIYYYFENQQVTSYRLDMGTNKLEMWLKEGKIPLPEATVQMDDEQTGGLLNSLGAAEEDMLPANGGTVYVTYKLPYGVDFNTGKISDFVDAYNEANPDAPMIFDYVAAKTSIPWLEIIFYVVMLGSLGMLFMSMYRGGAGGGIMNVGRAKVKDQQENQRRATFADVAGADEEKAELQEVVEFLKAPGKFNSLGARIPHGVLLVGPPGTGKTLLARACAGEAGVPFYAISGSDFVEMYVGVGASRVRDLFEKAKKTMPSIVFIDEIDAVGRQRGAGLGGGHDEREQTLNQLLVEMDGFDANDGVIVMAATNRADILDKALLRPGRFDRQVYVGLPDVKGREEILKVHTKNKPLGPDVSLKTIARTTAGFSGADLENLVNEAALLAARRGKKAITEPEIEEASVKVMMGPEKKSHVVTDDERRLVAYHETGHAITGYFGKHHDPVHQISIISRGGAGGYTMYLPEKDPSYVTKTAMFENIVSLLGGRVAEQLVLDDISTGASNDLQRATDTARAMVTRYGFSERMGPVVYGSDPGQTFLGRDFGQGKGYSEAIASEIDNEIRDIVDEAYETARRLLTEHMTELHKIATILMEREKISGDEFRTLMEGGTLPPFDLGKGETAKPEQDTSAPVQTPEQEEAPKPETAAEPDADRPDAQE
ncbi:ATP-dependent zinc metalloprotease FtsH [uncultured Subdoligranulum sp.]|uniref:ATP-dependent zinc metalloprotease FtsH n=1 Tax=uncultured Subdoligranulum sp. TaxID=512298 RepID=UPI00260FAE6D|nr:ATP-dependent zinc metalloprotease FtsH [uncultured Subdoligranulum sp.]